MCMNDWRIGRLIKSNRRLHDFSAVSTFTIPKNQQRVALEVSMTRETLFVTDSIASSNPGFLVSVDGSAYRSITILDHSFKVNLVNDGDLPLLSFLLTDVGYSDVICITEWTLPEQVLAEALENLKREYPSWKL